MFSLSLTQQINVTYLRKINSFFYMYLQVYICMCAYSFVHMNTRLLNHYKKLIPKLIHIFIFVQYSYSVQQYICMRICSYIYVCHDSVAYMRNTYARICVYVRQFKYLYEFLQIKPWHH